MKQRTGSWLGGRGRFVSSFRQKAKCLLLALSQVNKEVISSMSLLVIIRKSEKVFLFKSYARGWFTSLSCFSGHKMVRDFRKQDIGEISQPPLFSGRTRLQKVPHCQSSLPFCPTQTNIIHC